MLGKIIRRIWHGCWEHEWVDIGNGDLTNMGQVFAQCAKCFKTKSFPPYKAGNFVTYREWAKGKYDVRQRKNP